MGRLGWSEIMLIMLIALVVFGPNRLPEIARQIGRAIREVRKVSGQFQEEVRTTFALDDLEKTVKGEFPYMRGPVSDAPSGPSLAPTVPPLPDPEPPPASEDPAPPPEAEPGNQAPA